MSYLEEIESLILDNINLDWYKRKNFKFISNKTYNAERNILLKNASESNEIYDEVDGEVELIKIETIELPDFEYNFSEFCWLDIDYLDIIHNHDFSRPKQLPDAYWVCNDIIEIIDKILPITNISESYNLIQAFVRTIEDVFDQIGNRIIDEEMTETTSLLKIMFTQSIRFKYRQIFELENLAVLRNDSLSFKINKSELTGLITILIEADVLELPKTGGRYDFFEKYFRWVDGNGKFQPLRNIKGDISKIKSQDSTDRRTKGALDIFGKLEDGFNSL